MLNKIKDNFLRMIVRSYLGLVAGMVGGIITGLVLALAMNLTGDYGWSDLVSPTMMATGALFGGILAGVYGIVHNKEE